MQDVTYETGGFQVQMSFVTCRWCNRKVVVERVVTGALAEHHVVATCGDCLKTHISEDFRRDHAEAAAAVLEFLGTEPDVS